MRLNLKLDALNSVQASHVYYKSALSDDSLLVGVVCFKRDIWMQLWLLITDATFNHICPLELLQSEYYNCAISFQQLSLISYNSSNYLSQTKENKLKGSSKIWQHDDCNFHLIKSVMKVKSIAPIPNRLSH